MKINKDDIKEMDFSFLEGKEIDYYDYMGNTAKAIIVECNYYIGISIMDINKEIYYSCFRGPSAWRAKNVTPEANGFSNENELYKFYDNNFYEKLNQLVNGYYNADMEATAPEVTSDHCAFI